MTLPWDYMRAEDAQDCTPDPKRYFPGAFSSEEIHNWFVPMQYTRSGVGTYYRGVPFPLVFAQSGETPPEPEYTSHNGSPFGFILSPGQTTRVCRGFPFTAITTTWKLVGAPPPLGFALIRCPLQSHLKDVDVDRIAVSAVQGPVTDARKMEHQRGAVAISMETRATMTRRYPGFQDNGEGVLQELNPIAVSPANPNPANTLQGYHSYVNYNPVNIESGIQTTYRHLRFFKSAEDVPSSEFQSLVNEIRQLFLSTNEGRVETSRMIGIRFGYYGRKGKILRLWHSRWAGQGSINGVAFSMEEAWFG